MQAYTDVQLVKLRRKNRTCWSMILSQQSLIGKVALGETSMTTQGHAKSSILYERMRYVPNALRKDIA